MCPDGVAAVVEGERSGPRVKLCGLTRRDDVLLADGLGADYLGLVLSRGFGRSVEPAAGPALVHGTKATKVAVLVDETADDAESLALTVGAGVIQLHGDESEAVLRELRDRGPWTLWKSVRARSLGDVQRAVDRFADLADGLLVEGWREGVVGGGGAVLELSPQAVRAAIPQGVAFVLAGGLAPGTVADAVALFLPDVVDVSSGIEAIPGRKDPELARAFVRAARASRRPAITPREEGPTP
jgi:phosphoribosylanthranilate isomerase